MSQLSDFDPSGASNPNYNIFGLPTTEEEARVVIFPVPWEVTVSYSAGTARAADHIMKASMQVDLYDPDHPDTWREGFFMRPPDKKMLLKSDYLRKEAELLIDYVSRGELIEKNSFMCKSLREINEGGALLNKWVYEQTKDLLDRNKLVCLLGGDHSSPFGYYKAQAERHPEFAILQIDAHCDLRKSYEQFSYSHASIMYNVVKEISEVKKIVQVGVRDYSKDELDHIAQSNGRIVTYFDKDIKERQYEGTSWKQICQDIIQQLPEKVHLSFDIDGLDPKLCPHTGTPVQGGFETEQVLYLLKTLIASGRRLIGIDLNEIGVGENDWDANVGARLLFRLCNILIASNN